MDTKLSFIDECVLLGIPLSTSMNINITGSVNSFYVKSNSVLRDFNLLPCDVIFSLLSTYCMDAYGCQLWNYSNNSNDRYYCAWRKVLRHMWDLPYTTHNRLIPIIFDTKPIEIILELRCIKFISSCINSDNDVVRIVTAAALNNRKSILGLNFRYLAFKYKIHRHLWYGGLPILLRKLNMYIDRNLNGTYDDNVIGNYKGVMFKQILLSMSFVRYN